MNRRGSGPFRYEKSNCFRCRTHGRPLGLLKFVGPSAGRLVQAMPSQWPNEMAGAAHAVLGRSGQTGWLGASHKSPINRGGVLAHQLVTTQPGPSVGAGWSPVELLGGTFGSGHRDLRL